MMNVLCTGNKNKPKINTIVNNLCSLFQNTDHKLYIDKKIENVVKGKSFDYLNLYKPSKHIDFEINRTAANEIQNGKLLAGAQKCSQRVELGRFCKGSRTASKI